MAKFMSFDLGQMTNKLYINAKDAFVKKGFKTTIDVTDANNPVFLAEKESQRIELPANKNIVIQKSSKSLTHKEVKGIHVCNGKEFHINESVLKIVK
ncbi:hypothetical protein [Peribacillus glennii]|uniref:hypothetical protein n=1 Tax=Peribacillus glennii TaxID=2303991 RepID=UPI0026D7C19D